MKFSASILALVALHLRGVAAQQFTPNLTFNITLNTMCALFEWWIPENVQTRNELDGWIPWESWYTGSLDIAPSQFYTGMIGQGDPFHYVSAKWYNPLHGLPSFTFTFPGMGWSLAGNWAPWNATTSRNDVEIRADGGYTWLTDPSRDLGGQNELSWGMHTVNYSIRADYQGGGNLTVTELTLVTGMVSDAPSFSDVPVKTEYFVVNGQRNPDFLYNGMWEVLTEFGGWGGQSPISYTQLFTNSSTENNLSMVQISIPDNTSFVLVNGTMGPDYGLCGAVWEPVPSIGKSPVGFDAYTAWDVPNAVMFFQPLNPKVRYNLTLGLPYSNHMGMGLTSITYWNAISGASTTTNGGNSNNGGNNNNNNGNNNNGNNGNNGNSDSSNSGSQKKSTPIGAIVGGVVGGVVAIAIAATLIFCCLKRRRNAGNKSHEADMSRFEVDESAAHTTPFLVQNSMSPPPTMPEQQMHQPVVQTYTVQSTGGGYTTGGYTTGGYTTGGYADGGYVPQDVGPRGSVSTVPLSSPGLYSTSSGAGLLGAQRSATSDMDEASSVSPSMSASVVAASAESKGAGTPAIASFSQPQFGQASGSQTYPVTVDEKSAQSHTQAPAPPPRPITQELDAGAVDLEGAVPPVYNPQWAGRHSGQHQ